MQHPHDKSYKDEQGRAWGGRPNLVPMPDRRTRCCCLSETKYKAEPMKGCKRKADTGNPGEGVKRARKGEGKSKVSSGTMGQLSSAVGTCVGVCERAYKSAEFIGEDIDMEEGRMLDVALAISVSTHHVESML